MLAAWLCGGLAAGMAAAEGPELAVAQQDSKSEEKLPRPKRIENGRGKPPPKEGEIEALLPPKPASILPKDMNAVDLHCVLRVAGMENPDILIARQRIAVAEALRFGAYAMILPNFNGGTNYDAHTGPLQQSSGNILTVNRNALYVGAGAGAVAAGTVGVPGIQYNINISEGLFGALAVNQQVRIRRYESVAVRNQMFLRVAQGYMDLLWAEGKRAIAEQNRDESHEIARLTAVYAWTGQGKQSDADRAAAELAKRNAELVQAEGDMLVASAKLVALLNIPPSVQLHAVDGWVAPTPLVPDPIPMTELLFIAMNQRPELAAKRAAIRQAVLMLYNAKVLPFSPTVLAGYSAGTFGGGSNLIGQPGGFQGFAQARFGSFGARDDIDVVMFWTARNAGVGNWAQIRRAGAERRLSELELVRELNTVRADVATAYAGTHARYAQIGIAQRGMNAGHSSYKEDLDRIKGGQGLPIELINSFDLLAAARYQYLDAIVEYNKAQFALYVALGQPPASTLAHAIPEKLVPLPAPAPPLPACAAANGACAACQTPPVAAATGPNVVPTSAPAGPAMPRQE
jgi:outer membrane protein TolC